PTRRSSDLATAEVVESAGRTGRGAEAAMIADEARWIETTDADALAGRTVKDLKELAREEGLPTSGKKQDLIDRLVARERKTPEDAEFDPKVGAYRPKDGAPGSSFVAQHQKGLRDALSLDPERNFRSHLERLTDWVMEHGEDAVPIAGLTEHPLTPHWDDGGPALDGPHTARCGAEAQGQRDPPARRPRDGVVLSDLGPTQATARVERFSLQLYAAMAEIKNALGERRKSVMAPPYIPVQD